MYVEMQLEINIFLRSTTEIFVAMPSPKNSKFADSPVPFPSSFLNSTHEVFSQIFSPEMAILRPNAASIIFLRGWHFWQMSANYYPPAIN